MNTSKPSLFPSMAGNKVLLFGSFTEEETMLMQSSTTSQEEESKCNPVQVQGQSSASATEEKVEFQFGSLDFSSLALSTEPIPTVKKTFSPTVSSNQNWNVKKAGDVIVTNKYEASSIKELLSNGHSIKTFPNYNGVVGKEPDEFNMSSPQSSSKDDPPSESPRPILHQVDSWPKQEEYTPVESAGFSVRGANRVVNEKKSLKTTILPHGLINSGSTCFLNATLQALISCSPFTQFLQDLKNQHIPKSGYPTLSAFIDFISLFNMSDDVHTKDIDRGVLVSDKALNPLMFDAVLRKFNPDLQIRGRMSRQEDAQEFLGFVMDCMHDELLKLSGHSNFEERFSSILSSIDDDGWETVGPKNKTAKTTVQSFSPSELSAIFGGELHSVVKAAGSKASATIQPFLLLHLDILPESVHTIQDALHLFSAPETLEGYKPSSGKAGVSARKSVKIHKLPKILILHLKRFNFGTRGSTKLHKPVQFPFDLVLSRDLFVSSSTEGRRFELVATVTHHGNEPSRGHYTADARYGGQWLRYNDTYVSVVSPNAVLQDSAYILFYEQVH